MNRSKEAIAASLKLANSLLLTRVTTTRQLHSRVTHFSRFTSFSSSCCHPRISHFPNYTYQRLCFSTQTKSILDLVVENEWSRELESKLDELNSELTHEGVIYILKKLDKEPDKAYGFFKWVSEGNRFRPSSMVYSMMARILVNQASLKQFWIVLRKMKDERFYLDEETYLSILGVLKKASQASDVAALNHFYDRMVKENAMDSLAKDVVKVILSAEWDEKVERKLEEVKTELSDNLVIRVLKELRNYPSKVFRFFCWVGVCSGYGHNTITYNATLRVLARHDSVKEFWRVVEVMKEAGHDIDIDTYIKVSRQFQKSRMAEDAVKLFELMMDSPYKPSVQDCNLLLRSLSTSDGTNMDLVYRVAKKYESSGNFISKAIYDGIHRSLTTIGRFDEAQKIVKVMKTAGYEPDNITYSQLVFGLCKARRLEEAYKVLEEMEANGCIPDVKTWTILIQGHCSANEVDKALLYFSKMMERNCDADADLLDVLVKGFLNQNRVNGAYELFTSLVEKAHIRPWQANYKMIIEKLLGVRKLEEAMSLLRLMKKQNYPPHSEPFVRYISMSGTVEDALDFLKALSMKEYPSSSAYNHVFESFFREGRHSEAKDLFYKCPPHIRQDSKILQLFGSAKNRKAPAQSRNESTQI